MSNTGELIIEEKDRICTITLNRPEKRNSLTPTMLLEIASGLKRIKDEGNARCTVIRGSGDKAFSSGYDISAIGKLKDDMMRDYTGNHPLIIAAKAIENFPYPVIAMINGHAFGGGLEITLSCDLRISVDSALFGMPPAKLGVIYAYSGVRKFLNLVGLGYTKEFFLTGRNIDAKKAEKIGLVNYILPQSELEEFTYKLASEISENAPLSMSTMKEMINAWQRNQTFSSEDEETIKEMILKVQESEDYKEGQRAFAEKRKPKFQGK
ncbi:MAG TPA: enoyl-CoA hydratase-related protein [Thermodesulfobacteriota bacterium]|nr:enoyl-CoA hydratase-related protein [Thermodesulfobacteriota bacterium]